MRCESGNSRSRDARPQSATGRLSHYDLTGQWMIVSQPHTIRWEYGSRPPNFCKLLKSGKIKISKS
jgi:hypothetical protein